MTLRYELAIDHIRRSNVRLRAVDLLFDGESWADVVRESQEVVELVLKGLLLANGVSPPRTHDVSAVLLSQRDRLPDALRSEVDEFAGVSRRMRRDRELAFYGAEDLIPSKFYTRADAEESRDAARRVFDLVAAHVVPEER